MSPRSLTEELKELRPVLSVGVLTADLANLGSEVSMLEAAGARLVHFDVMDGCFCPKMTVGPPLIGAVNTRLLKDVHLMIAEPLEKLKEYVAAGADIITVHHESCLHIHRVLQALGGMTNANDASRGVLRGLALNPGTPIDAMEPLLDEIDLLLVLAVNPGWSGQAFARSGFRRIERAQEMISHSDRNILLGIDGGITRGNVAEVANTGVDLIVAGSAIFDGKSPERNARAMLQALRDAAG